MSDIQLVCNYLKNLERISNYNLFFYNLTEKINECSDKDYYINTEYINEDECHIILRKYINKNIKSYHEINIFIKILADLLRRFSINCYLMIESLKCNFLSGDIRKDLIQAFLNLTNCFVGNFDNICDEQNLSLKKNHDYDEDIQIKKMIFKLTVEEKTNILFEQLNNKGFIFINNDGQSLTIITCASKESEIYKKLNELINSDAKDYRKFKNSIPDFTKMKKAEEYLEVIKIMVDSKEDIQLIKKKLGSYVFNEDNFSKMVHILLRFRVGIPVLIMGETGCGKTSLINAIAKINNYRLITFNIHAGVTDNDIIDFMIKHNFLEKDFVHLNILNVDEDYLSFPDSAFSMGDALKTEKEINEDRNNLKNEQFIIVFFDDFNKCNSLPLLTEIMCNKRCKGAKVKQNVLFAGACKPYRKKQFKREEYSKL